MKENLQRKLSRQLWARKNQIKEKNWFFVVTECESWIIDKTTNTNLGIVVSGKLAIKGDSANEEYEIAKDEDFSEIVQTVKTNDSKEIILDLDEGVYYSRKKGSEEVSKHIVKDGHAVFANAIYGHEYEFKEIEAPSSYELSKEPFEVNVVADKDQDIITYTFKNNRVDIPNTGVWLWNIKRV